MRILLLLSYWSKVQAFNTKCLKMTLQPNKDFSLNEHVRAKHSKFKEYIMLVSRQLDLILFLSQLTMSVCMVFDSGN